MPRDDLTISGHARPGSDFYYASLYRRPAERDRVRLVNALHEEIASIPLQVSDRGVARVKLDWWHTEAAEFAEGRPRHELTRTYHRLYGQDDGMASAVHALALGLDRELGGVAWETDAAQFEWFEQTFGPIYERYGAAADADSPAHATALRRCGAWLEMGYALLQLKIMANKQLHRFPIDSLANAGCHWEDVIAGTNTAAVQRFVTAQTGRIVDGLSAQTAPLSKIRGQYARTALTLAAILERTLAEMQADGCRVWLHRVQLTPLRKLWCAYATRWF